MKQAKYWAFDKRHPKSNEPESFEEILLRIIDRIDDFLTAVMSTFTYWRITQDSRIRGHSDGS